MKITCQSCQSKYTVSDEKVQGKTVKIKCRKCSATILVSSTGATTTNGSVSDPVSIPTGTSEGATYLVNVTDGDQRSMSLAEVVSSYNASVITAETYVWSDGMADWAPLGQVDAIVAALSGGAAPAAPASMPDQPAQQYEAPAAQPAYGDAASQQSGYGAAAASAQPSYPGVSQSQPAYAAASQPAYGGASASQPSFGAAVVQPAQPSSYHPPAAAAPEPAAARAAVRRDPARPTHDLFGGGLSQERPSDVATSAPLFSSKPATTGQRDENSMLFSLSALTAKGPAGAAPSTTSARDHEDSGVIDLKALSAGAAPASPVAALVPDDGGLFQLSAPIGAGGQAAPALVIPDAMPQKNRGPLYVGVGIAVAGLAIAGAFFGMKGGAEQPVPAATTEIAQTTAPPVTPPTTPEPSSTAVDPGAAPTASASAKVAVGGPRPGGPRPGGPGPGGTAKGTPAGAATTASKPAPNPCGCAAGDLMCNMACSAKKK